MQNDTARSASTGDKINDFVQRNRNVVLAILGIMVFLFAASIIFLSLKDSFQKKAIEEVEELNRKYTDLRYASNGLAVDDLAGDSSAEMEELLQELNDFAKNKGRFAGIFAGGFASGKAWWIIAQIHSSRKEWPQAEEAWRRSAKAGARTYMGPMALFNAAAAAEEQGKLQEAIELLESSVAHTFEFPSAPRAQFAIGRLNEELENRPAALEAYRAVLINWPNLPVWANMAHSRIAALETELN